MFRRCVVHLVPRAPLHAVTGAPFVGQLSQLLSAAATEHNYRSCLWVPVDLLRQIDRFECEGGTADPAGTISNKAESPIGNGNGNAVESAPPQSHGEMNTKQMKQKKKSKATQKELSPKQAAAAAETRSPTSASPESEFKVLLRRGATVTPGYAVNSFLQLRNMQKQHQVTQTVLNNSAADNNSSALFREKNFVQFVNMDDVCLPHNVDVRSLFHHHFTQPHRFSRRQRDSGQEAAAVAGHLLGMEESFHVGAAAAPMPWHFRNVVGGGFSADVCALLVQAHVQQNYKSLNWVEESELALLGWSVKQNATVVEVPPQMFKKKTRTPMLSSSSVSSSAAPSELQFSDPSDRSKKYYNIEDVVDAVSFNEFFLRDRRVIKVESLFCGGRASSKGGAVDASSSNKISNSFPDSSTSPFRAKFYPPLMTLEWQVHLSCFLGLNPFDPLARIGGTTFDFARHLPPSSPLLEEKRKSQSHEVLARKGFLGDDAAAAQSTTHYLVPRIGSTIPFVHGSSAPHSSPNHLDDGNAPQGDEGSPTYGGRMREYFVAAQLGGARAH